VRASLFRGDADPRQADDEEDLGEDQIAEAEFALQQLAARLDRLDHAGRSAAKRRRT